MSKNSKFMVLQLLEGFKVEASEALSRFNALKLGLRVLGWSLRLHELDEASREFNANVRQGLLGAIGKSFWHGVRNREIWRWACNLTCHRTLHPNAWP